MGDRSYAALRINGTADPRSVAVVIDTFREMVCPGWCDPGQTSPEDLGPWGDAGGYEVTGEQVSWGTYLEFPDWVTSALRGHEGPEGDPDPLPLVAFDWYQEGYGETTDWELRCRPDSDGTRYLTVEVSTVCGERFVTESVARAAVASHPEDPAVALAEVLAHFDGPPPV